MGLFDSDPKTNVPISAAMVVVGLVLVALFVRYLRKPVRGEGPRGRSPYLPP